MKDLKIDALTRDLSIKNHDLEFVTDLDRVAQKLRIKLNHIFGEWFLNNSEGIKYFENVMVKNPNIPLVESLLKAAILETENVKEILEFSTDLDLSLRKLTVRFKVLTDFGSVSLTEVI